MLSVTNNDGVCSSQSLQTLIFIFFLQDSGHLRWQKIAAVHEPKMADKKYPWWSKCPGCCPALGIRKVEQRAWGKAGKALYIPHSRLHQHVERRWFLVGFGLAVKVLMVHSVHDLYLVRILVGLHWKGKSFWLSGRVFHPTLRKWSTPETEPEQRKTLKIINARCWHGWQWRGPWWVGWLVDWLRSCKWVVKHKVASLINQLQLVGWIHTEFTNIQRSKCQESLIMAISSRFRCFSCWAHWRGKTAEAASNSLIIINHRLIFALQRGINQLTAREPPLAHNSQRISLSGVL